MSVAEEFCLSCSCVGTTTPEGWDGFDSPDDGCIGTTTEDELFADDGEARRESLIARSFSVIDCVEEDGAGVSTSRLRRWDSPELR